MTNPDNLQSPTDTGTPVQAYVGPQAEVTLPPWRPAPLVQQKQDDSFSEAEMQAIRTTADQEVDAKRAFLIQSLITVVLSATYLVLLFSVGLSVAMIYIAFFAGWYVTYAAHLSSTINNNQIVNKIRQRQTDQAHNASLGLPPNKPALSAEDNPYISNLRKNVTIFLLLVIIFAIILLISLRPLGSSFPIASAGLSLVLVGLGSGLLFQYLTLCRGLGKVNEAERQRKIDELISKWQG